MSLPRMTRQSALHIHNHNLYSHNCKLPMIVIFRLIQYLYIYIDIVSNNSNQPIGRRVQLLPAERVPVHFADELVVNRAAETLLQRDGRNEPRSGDAAAREVRLLREPLDPYRAHGELAPRDQREQVEAESANATYTVTTVSFSNSNDYY